MSDEDKVKIGCRLPSGYLLRWRGDRVMLQGADGVERSGDTGFQTLVDPGVGVMTPSGYGITELDRDWWLGWLSENDGRNEIRNRQIFEIV